MIRPFTAVVVLEAVLLGGWALGAAVARRGLPISLTVGLLVLEGMLIVHGLAAGASLLLGHHADQPATHLAYLVTSIAVLPLVLGRPPPLTESGTQRPDPWRSALVALGCFAVVVVVLRMWATWQPAHA